MLGVTNIILQVNVCDRCSWVKSSKKVWLIKVVLMLICKEQNKSKFIFPPWFRCLIKLLPFPFPLQDPDVPPPVTFCGFLPTLPSLWLYLWHLPLSPSVSLLDASLNHYPWKYYNHNTLELLHCIQKYFFQKLAQLSVEQKHMMHDINCKSLFLHNQWMRERNMVRQLVYHCYTGTLLLADLKSNYTINLLLLSIFNFLNIMLGINQWGLVLAGKELCCWLISYISSKIWN